MAAQAHASPSVALIAPYVAAVIFLLLSPVTAALAKRIVDAQINKDNIAAGEATMLAPAAQTRENIGDYIDFATDWVQVSALTLLPVIGALFAASGRIDNGIALSVLIVIVLAAIGIDAWMGTTAPQDYVSRKVLGYSWTAVAGLAANVASIVIVAIFGT